MLTPITKHILYNEEKVPLLTVARTHEGPIRIMHHTRNGTRGMVLPGDVWQEGMRTPRNSTVTHWCNAVGLITVSWRSQGRRTLLTSATCRGTEAIVIPYYIWRMLLATIASK